MSDDEVQKLIRRSVRRESRRLHRDCFGPLCELRDNIVSGEIFELSTILAGLDRALVNVTRPDFYESDDDTGTTF